MQPGLSRGFATRYELRRETVGRGTMANDLDKGGREGPIGVPG